MEILTRRDIEYVCTNAAASLEIDEDRALFLRKQGKGGAILRSIMRKVLAPSDDISWSAHNDAYSDWDRGGYDRGGYDR